MQPTIFIPGIKGTTLVNTNTLDFDTIWSGIQCKFETILDLELCENTRFEISPKVIIERGDIEDLAYREAVVILERKIKTPVFIFGYDWRKSCAENGRRLKAFVDYLQEKLSISCFNFLTHSMGGMVFSCYLKELRGNYETVDHAVMTVCPFLGAVGALVGLIVGEGGIRLPFFNSNDEFRKIARSFPSVYELCPVYPNAVTFHAHCPDSPGSPPEDSDQPGPFFDIYNPAHWQSNITGHSLFRSRLAHFKYFRDPADPAMLPLHELPDEVKKRFLIIAGEGEETKAWVVVHPNDPSGRVTNFFDFNQPPGGGDGTVPIASSTAYKDHILTRAVQSKWFDKATHAFFLNDGRVQSIISRFLKDDTTHPLWWSDIGGTVRRV